MSIADEIEKLNALRQSGALTEEEFQAAKATALRQGEGAAGPASPAAPAKPLDDHTWAMLLHISQFSGFIIPFAGFIVPIVLWQIKKEQSAVIDRHGRIVANWLITALIAGSVFWILCFILIGMPLLLILAFLCVVFPIIGAIKASHGEAWSYPLAYKFLPID
jgi:uncharacterized Tic20 family protein